MPSESEVEAAAKAMWEWDGANFDAGARAILTAAEKVREEARTEEWKCSRNPPCDEGECRFRDPGCPKPEARTQSEAGQVEQPQHKDTENRAEVEEARVIPNEAVEAGAEQLWDGVQQIDEAVRRALTAALPHLEAAWQKQRDIDWLAKGRHQEWEEHEAAIRADERAKVRERISELRGGSPEYSQGVADALVAVRE